MGMQQMAALFGLQTWLAFHAWLFLGGVNAGMHVLDGFSP